MLRGQKKVAEEAGFKAGDKVSYETSKGNKNNRGTVHSVKGDTVTIKGSNYLGGDAMHDVHHSMVKKIEEAHHIGPHVKKDHYHWGRMLTVHHGKSHSFPMHPEHQQAIHKMKDGESLRYKDETGSTVHAARDGDMIHLSKLGVNTPTMVHHSHFGEDADPMVMNLPPVNTTGGSQERTNKLAGMAAGQPATPAPMNKQDTAKKFLSMEEADQSEHPAEYMSDLPNMVKDLKSKRKGSSDMRREYGSSWKRLLHHTDREYGNSTMQNTLAMAQKHMKEEATLQEAKRGRPRKNAGKTDEENPDREHIIMGMRKAISLRGMHPVAFDDGKKHLISPGTANRVLNMHDNMKTPTDKQAFAARIARSKEHMHDALAGKPEEKAPAISLGGSKNVGGIGANSK